MTLLLSTLMFGAMFSVLTVSLNLQHARGGMINFGTVAYFAAGAYAYAIVTQEPPHGLDQYAFGFDAPWWVGFLAAGVASTVFALLTGWPTLRLRGEYLALTTFAFAEVFHSVLLNERRLGNGSVGLSNVERPDPGAIGLEDTVGYVPQDNNTFAEMTVRDNLLASAVTFEGTAPRIEDTYRRFPILKERSTQLAATLSGGERQTLAIANALVGAPKLLILDEPTAGLAPIFVDRIIDWIQDLAQEGMSVIWVVEQNPEKILKISRTAWMLDAGRNRETLPSVELLVPGRLEEMLLQEH